MNRLTLRRALAVACTLALAAACLLIAGCGNSSSSDADGASDSNNHVVIGYWGGTCEAPIYVGYELGFFEEAGLDVELLLITEDVTPLMANDELHCFELTPDKFKSMEQGADLAIIDSLHIGCIQGCATVESGIKSPADLEGHKVAADLGSIAQIQLASEMVKAGKDPNKVEWLSYPIGQQISAMESGEVDAFAQYDPWGDIAEEKGYVKFYSNTYDEGLNNALCCFVGMSTKKMEENPELAAKLCEGFKKSAEYLQENPEEAVELILDKGYVQVGGDNGFTKEMMLKEISDYTWTSGDSDLIKSSFYEIWMQIYRAGAMEDAPEEGDALDQYINETLYEKMVKLPF